MPDPDMIEAFEIQARRVGAVVHRLAAPSLVERFLELLAEVGAQSVALAGTLPEHAALHRAALAAGLALVAPADLGPTRRADAGLSRAQFGVAETGSVLLHSTPTNRLVELCVDVHMVVIEAASIVPTLDQALAELRILHTQPAGYSSLVSGPSRSADIERTLTIGVHGPRALHLLLLSDS